ALMLVRRSAERATIGVLVWVGIFGLGIGSYYDGRRPPHVVGAVISGLGLAASSDGRSHPQVLVAIFSAWSLALALLVVVAVRSAAAGGRRIGPAQVALFVGFGL